MAYMKVNLAKPILSCGVITNGIPYIVPMVLKKDGSHGITIFIYENSQSGKPNKINND
jgi:hypothetical protein